MPNSYYLIYDGIKQVAQLNTLAYTLAAAIKEAEKMKATKILRYEAGATQAMRVVWKRDS